MSQPNLFRPRNPIFRQISTPCQRSYLYGIAPPRWHQYYLNPETIYWWGTGTLISLIYSQITDTTVQSLAMDVIWHCESWYVRIEHTIENFVTSWKTSSLNSMIFRNVWMSFLKLNNLIIVKFFTSSKLILVIKIQF